MIIIVSDLDEWVRAPFMATVIMSSNLIIDMLFCPWEKHLSKLGCRLVVESTEPAVMVASKLAYTQNVSPITSKSSRNRRITINDTIIKSLENLSHIQFYNILIIRHNLL